MFVPFESLPSTARVWIFQANRALTEQESHIAETGLRAFTDEWVVHGSPLDCSYSIRYSRFIILAADESRQGASGCSIDSSVRALKDIEGRLHINLFDRNLVTFLQDGKVVSYPLGSLKEKFADGMLTGETLAFNNLVDTKQDLEAKWLLPAGETWLRRYLPNTLVNVK